MRVVGNISALRPFSMSCALSATAGMQLPSSIPRVRQTSPQLVAGQMVRTKAA